MADDKMDKTTGLLTAGAYVRTTSVPWFREMALLHGVHAWHWHVGLHAMTGLEMSEHFTPACSWLALQV